MRSKIQFSKFILYVLFALTPFQGLAQVAYSEYFTQDHVGSFSIDEDKIDYRFVFKEQINTNYFAEGSTIEKSSYQLEIDLRDKSYSFDLDFRNLIVSLYIELKVPFSNETRTITSVYQKAQRWTKVKGVIPKDCQLKTGSTWGRKNDIQSFDEILTFFVESIIRHIDFENCL